MLRTSETEHALQINGLAELDYYAPKPLTLIKMLLTKNSAYPPDISIETFHNIAKETSLRCNIDLNKTKLLMLNV